MALALLGFGLITGVSHPARPVEPIGTFASFTPLPPNTRPAAERRVLLGRQTGLAPTAAVVERVTTGPGRRDWIEVEYTVDPVLEAELRTVLEDLEVGLGHTILLDPRSGEVFAYLSTDPETFPATRTYPMASLMKVVTAAAALRREPATADRDCHFRGSPYALDWDLLLGPMKGAAVHSFRRAMAVSNNQCFARLAVDSVGKAGLLAELQKIGFREPPALHHPPGEVEPLRDALDLGYLGSGLAGAAVAPLGAARLAGLLAEGTLVRPFWIARLRDAAGRSLPVPGRNAPRLVWPPRVVETLRHSMADVTETGTARRAFHDESGAPRLGEVRVVGKTGTLSGTDPKGRYQWFIGVAPAEAPRVAIATVVVDDVAGGASAADVAAASLRGIFCRGDACHPRGAERLYTRARAREAETLRAIANHSEALANARAVANTHNVVDLDQPPRPFAGTRLTLPRHLRHKPANGEIVVVVTLDPDGQVERARIESSTLPAFDAAVLDQVKTWSFSPPTRQGEPVRAEAQIPIPITIK